MRIAVTIILSHVSDDRLPAIADVHMLHSDILVPAVTQPSKGLDLDRIGRINRAAPDASGTTRRSVPPPDPTPAGCRYDQSDTVVALYPSWRPRSGEGPKYIPFSTIRAACFLNWAGWSARLCLAPRSRPLFYAAREIIEIPVQLLEPEANRK